MPQVSTGSSNGNGVSATAVVDFGTTFVRIQIILPNQAPIIVIFPVPSGLKYSRGTFPDYELPTSFFIEDLHTRKTAPKDKEIKTGLEAFCKPGAIPMKYLLYILAKTEGISDYPPVARLRKTFSKEILRDLPDLILVRFWKELLKICSKKVDAGILFETIVITVPCSWKRITNSYVEVVEKAAKKVGWEVQVDVCFEIEGMAHSFLQYLLRKGKLSMSEGESCYFLFFDLGGHTLNVGWYYAYKGKRKLPSLLEYGDPQAVNGGGEYYDWLVGNLIANHPKLRALAKLQRVEAFQSLLENFRPRKPRLFANKNWFDHPMDDERSEPEDEVLLSGCYRSSSGGEQPINIYISRKKMEACLHKAFKEPIELFKKEIESMKTLRPDATVVLSGGSFHIEWVKNGFTRYLQSRRIWEPCLYHKIDPGSTMSDVIVDGIAFAYRNPISLEDFRNNCVLGIQFQDSHGKWNTTPRPLWCQITKTGERRSRFASHKVSEVPKRYKLLCHLTRGLACKPSSKEPLMNIEQCYDLYSDDLMVIEEAGEYLPKIEWESSKDKLSFTLHKRVLDKKTQEGRGNKTPKHGTSKVLLRKLSTKVYLDKADKCLKFDIDDLHRPRDSTDPSTTIQGSCQLNDSVEQQVEDVVSPARGGFEEFYDQTGPDPSKTTQASQSALRRADSYSTESSPSGQTLGNVRGSPSPMPIVSCRSFTHPSEPPSSERSRSRKRKHSHLNEKVSPGVSRQSSISTLSESGPAFFRRPQAKARPLEEPNNGKRYTSVASILNGD